MPTERRPDDPELNDEAAGWLGAYVHVPFCHRVCPYCDFSVVAGKDQLIDRYGDALITEIERCEPFDRPLDAVAVGGGTPSRLAAGPLRRVVDAVRDRCGLSSSAEVSLEANPEDWSPRYAEEMASAGFTRVSLGVQSFDAAVLGYLGRAHDPACGEGAVAAARDAGLASVSLDLIYGSPVETPESWRASLRRAVALGIDHLSTYALTVERGTALSRAVAGGAPAPDPDRQADAYEEALAVTGEAGLVRYETSNFAAPGHASRYNLLTWAQGEYLAFGCAAHGHRGGERTRSVARVERYLEAIESGHSAVRGTERLGRWGREQERVMLGLRRAAGVKAGCAGTALAGSDEGRRLIDAGVLALDGDRLRVVAPLLGDEVSRAVLALAPRDC
jgi:oxygen-independent coproporphyrinogen-3 oxidase